jgi:hypothetical protein
VEKPATVRWEEIVRPRTQDIKNLINVINSIGVNGTSNGTSVAAKVLARIDGHEDEILGALPDGYGDEIRGIQNITGIEMSQLILYQFSYEILGLCTSIVGKQCNAGRQHIIDNTLVHLASFNSLF